MKPYYQNTLLPRVVLLITAAMRPAAASDLSKNEGVLADSTKPGFRFKAAKPLVIAESVRIPREVSSVCSFGSAHGSGDLVLTMDGKVDSTVQCHGGQSTRSLAKITGLPDREHTLTGQYTNPHPAGFIPALDGFKVTRPDFWNYRKNRGLGETNDDVHLSEIKGSTGSYTFNGSGIEIHTTRDAESRSAHYTLDGGGSALWVGLSHYSPVTLPGQAIFRYPNLVPGTYTVGFKNAANPTGVNFPFVRMNIDAIRIYKGEASDFPGSAR